jgi:hypothetical protein
MKKWKPGLALLFVTWLCLAQGNSRNTAKPQQGPLSQQTPSVVPDVYELGRRAGITEEDHIRLGKVEERVDDIRGTITWMRGAWWALGGAITLVVIVIKFFGPSVFVAIEHRMAKARTDAMPDKQN